MQKFQCLKEKFGLCSYGVIYDKQEFILPEIQDDIEELKKENIESIKIKISEESTEESIEIKSPKKDENTTDWFDKNKLKKYQLLLTATKYNDIINLINNINNNTIS